MFRVSLSFLAIGFACLWVADIEVSKCPAAGFRDFPRSAASDPTMWRGVVLTNW